MFTPQISSYEELIKKRTSVSGSVKEVERFSTWWSNNIATTVVCNNGFYHVFLLIYVKRYDILKIFPSDHNCDKWGIGGRGRKAHNCLSDAQGEANWLRKELTDGCGKYYDNPILLIHPDCNVDKKFHEIVTESYVYKAEILTQDDCSLDFLLDALEPLDIVKIKRKTKDFKIEFYHSGIYLGNKQFFHMHDLVEKNLMKARIDDVSVFLGNTETSWRCGNVKIFCSIVPFQNWSKIIKNISWAEKEEFWKGRYDLFNRNCEHLVNMLIYRIDYSEQIAEFERERRVSWVKYVKENWKAFLLKPHRWSMMMYVIKACGKLNSGKGQFIELVSEIDEVNNKLQEEDSLRELEARIAISPKQEEFRIM